METNLLASPCFKSPHSHKIMLQENFPSASRAYNDAIEKSPNEIIVLLHQDIILPRNWPVDLERALTYLETNDANWGVLGCYGETLYDRGLGYVYSTGPGLLGAPFEHPLPVNTLDEIVLIVRKSSALRFDDSLPHFHMYGPDICMAAAKRGMKSYAISAFCIHNAVLNLVLPGEFYDCCKRVRRKWREFLPIQTTCVRLTRFGLPIYRKRLRELYLRLVRRKTIGAQRESNPIRLLRSVTDNQLQSSLARNSAEGIS